ncbi:hypothetical protein LSUE1_G002267 [Lachnellula suecica]|uniref:DUF7053 domain-containing protein n=1 Tax=Lachnellula suecica TaxID=602035 RepID=A0A8T9CJL4_9HELO|nr:hypothetical protein LSUE1_G002267 [Lachnellula suecica]
MSFFNSTRMLTTDTPLPSSVDTKSAIALLHDHTTFQNLQPLLLKNVVLSTPPEAPWLVGEAQKISESLPGPDKLPIEYRSVTIGVPMGPFTSEVITLSAWIDTEDGMILVFQSQMGLSGRDQWRVVKAAEGDGLVLREESSMTGFALMMSFVAGAKKESHNEVGRSFVKKLEESRTEEGGLGIAK